MSDNKKYYIIKETTRGGEQSFKIMKKTEGFTDVHITTRFSIETARVVVNHLVNAEIISSEVVE